MNKTILIIGIIFLLISISLAPLSGSISIKITISNNKNCIQSIQVQCQPIDKKTFNEPILTRSFEGTPISGGDFDEYHPSIVGAPGGEYYAMAEYTEDDLVWHPMLYGSTDGTVWDPLVEFLYDNSEYTDMDQNDYGTYGTFGAPPDDSGIIPVIQGEILDGWVWDFGIYNLNEFSHNRIACYTHKGPEGDPGEWNWGCITVTGYNGNTPGSEIEGCPYLFYQTTAAGNSVIDWLTGDVAGCEHVGSAMDLVTSMHYAVYDRDTGTGNYDLLIRKDNFGVWQQSSGGYWTHPMVTNLKITDTANLKFPSAAASNNNVIIACQKDADVIVYYSTNGLSSKTEVHVETDASYPEVAIAADETLVITYIKEETLYHKTSDDGGATWSDAEVVSDNQVNLNDRAANLDVDKGNIICAWEDTRGDNVDIYTNMVFEIDNYPPFAPVIKGKWITRLVELECYFNATDPDGDDVRYHIDWGDSYVDSTDFYKSGETVTVRHTYSEHGIYTIKACAEDTYGAKGPESTFIPFSRIKAINPLLSRLLGHFPLLHRLSDILKNWIVF